MPITSVSFLSLTVTVLVRMMALLLVVSLLMNVVPSMTDRVRSRAAAIADAHRHVVGAVGKIEFKDVIASPVVDDAAAQERGRAARRTIDRNGDKSPPGAHRRSDTSRNRQLAL